MCCRLVPGSQELSCFTAAIVFLWHPLYHGAHLPGWWRGLTSCSLWQSCWPSGPVQDGSFTGHSGLGSPELLLTLQSEDISAHVAWSLFFFKSSGKRQPSSCYWNRAESEEVLNKQNWIMTRHIPCPCCHQSRVGEARHSDTVLAQEFSVSASLIVAFSISHPQAHESWWEKEYSSLMWNIDCSRSLASEE